MAVSREIAAILRSVSNPIDESAFGREFFAGVIGDAPSSYSKSPQLWNAAFAHLQMDAVYLPFDVDNARLGTLLSALKDNPRFLGVNVTVPHKASVMEFLDELDASAARIQAVNTIVCASNEKLIGYNTDGEGFIDSLLKPQPGCDRPFVSSLTGTDVLLLGAGGSARAVAFHVADLQGDGRLYICNRTRAHADALAREIEDVGGHAVAIAEDELGHCATETGLIVNATTKGQGGVRRLGNGIATLLEPYSALAPAHPPSFAAAGFGKAGFDRQWLEAAQNDTEANHAASMQLARSIPAETVFYDLIYHPEETVYLRHARLTGHRTMNGKAMIVNQAALAFSKRICRSQLQARGLDRAEVGKDILSVMYDAW